MENRDDQNKNQTGQQGQQFTDKQGQQGQTAGEGQTGSEQGAFGKTGGETNLAEGQKSQSDKLRQDELGGDKGIVGTSKEKDTSETLVESGETDFAETGQGATESRTGSASNEDIETGAMPTRDAALDDGS